MTLTIHEDLEQGTPEWLQAILENYDNAITDPTEDE